MGRVRQLKSVLRYFVRTKRPGYDWSECYHFGTNRNWIVAYPGLQDVKLFKDKDEAERFLIQRKIVSGDAFWQDAEVRGEWMNL